MPFEPRPLPPETVQGLRPPRADFPYFAHADVFSFEPDADGAQAVNAWWLADASFLVYGDSAFVDTVLARSPLPRLGFRRRWLGTADDNRGMVLENDQVMVVVFRGTRLQVHNVLDMAEVLLIHQNDLWVDSQFLPAVFHAGGRVHSGFLGAFAQVAPVLDAIVQARRPEQRLWLAGHSLGGALATLAAAHLGKDAVQGLYTFGCPRVGDAAFASCLPTRAHCRYVHRNDWVATVPPGIMGYVHGGDPYPVPGSPPRNFWEDLRTGAGSLAVVFRTLASDLRLKMGDLPFKIAGLADHAPIYYATLLWNELLRRQGQA